MYIHFDISNFRLCVALKIICFLLINIKQLNFSPLPTFLYRMTLILHELAAPPHKIKFSIDLYVLILVLFSPFLMTSIQKGLSENGTRLFKKKVWLQN